MFDDIKMLKSGKVVLLLELRYYVEFLSLSIFHSWFTAVSQSYNRTMIVLLYWFWTLRLYVNWSIFGTFDWYLQEPCLFQWVSKIFRESDLFLALAVADPISYFLIVFREACGPTFVHLSASSFWIIQQCAGEYVTLKEKVFSELLMCTISSIWHDVFFVETEM